MIPITLLQNDQNGEQIQKAERNFILFYRMQICCIFTVSTQANMFVVLFFCWKCLCWNKPFFYSESLLHAIWEQHGATKPTNCVWLDLSLLLPITNICTLSMKPNLKMSNILSVLHCIKHNGRIENQIWDSNVYPLLHRQVIALSKSPFPSDYFSIFCTS